MAALETKGADLGSLWGEIDGPSHCILNTNQLASLREGRVWSTLWQHSQNPALSSARGWWNVLGVNEWMSERMNE